MLQRKWISTTITTNKQAMDMVRLFEKQQPKIGAFDTETTGLHIINDKPFIFQFGWLHPEELLGYTFAVDLERYPILSKQIIEYWNGLAANFDLYLGHNVKFDLHMLANIGLPYTVENLSDTMFYIRYAHDTLTLENGGPPLKLKEYAARYITHTAKDHERFLKLEQSKIAKNLNLKLKLRLHKCGAPPAKYQAKSYTLSVLTDIFKDPIADYTSLPDNVQKVYLDWLHEDVPIYLHNKITGLVESEMVPYYVLNREQLINYAHMDIVLTLEIYLALVSVIEARKNTTGLQIENNLILPLYEMERTGFKVDKEYLITAKNNMKTYIQERRRLLAQITGHEFSIGQHALIKNIMEKDFQIILKSTDANNVDLVISDLKRNNPEHPAIQVLELIQELRTLEKWYSTYILRFLRDLNNTDFLYTTINQVGTVSGRVTSDFQQFPKETIKTEDGTHLFHPRRMIIPHGGDYPGIIYLDYSQIELRFQAFYTILVGHPDLNLCRAYMPYQCHNVKYGNFDYTNPEHIKAWGEEWFLNEEPTQRWEPTDVHGATTQIATGINPLNPEFKKLRNEIGKRVNFAKNYGAMRNKIRQMFPNKSEEEITKIDNAYYTAFPGIKEYHAYCNYRATNYSHTTNLFGVRYYNVSGHKLKNLLIQGSAAYYLKWKIRQVYDYCKTHNLKSKFQMNIHDELSWLMYKDEVQEFFTIKQIMEDWPDTQIPIIAEMAITKTTWADKQEVKNLDEIQLYFSN